MSNGSNTRWDYAIQSAYESIPGIVDNWYKFRFNGGGPARSTNTEEDPEIGGSAASVTNEGPATGAFDVSLWFGQLDHFMEGIFGNDFAANVLTPGSALKWFTFQESQPDLLGGDKFTQFENGAVTSWGFVMPSPNGRITSSVELSFSNGNSSAATITEATPAVNTAPVMRSGGLITGIEIDDTPIATYFTTHGLRLSQITVDFTRATEDEPEVNVQGRGGISYGDLTCEIGLTAYDENRTLLNSLFANTSRKIEFSVRDANGDGYDFLFPSASPNGGEASAPAKNTKRTQTLPFRTSDITITRVDTP